MVLKPEDECDSLALWLQKPKQLLTVLKPVNFIGAFIMNFSQLQGIAIAKAKFNRYWQQVSGIASEIPALVPAAIQVERIGFTRNASNTPYIVYKVGTHRCCTFIKRSLFMAGVQALLKLRHNVEDRIQSMRSSPDFGLSVKAGNRIRYVPSIYLNKFFELCNQAMLERTEPQQCDCSDVYDMCLHSVATVLQPCFARRIVRSWRMRKKRLIQLSQK